MCCMQFLLIFGAENFSRLTRHPLLSFHYFYFQDTLSGSSAFLFLALCSLGSSHHGLAPCPLLQAPVTRLQTPLVKVDPKCPTQQKPSMVPAVTLPFASVENTVATFSIPRKRLRGFFPSMDFQMLPICRKIPLSCT